MHFEVNLAFDQFVFKLSEAVFTHYKQLAARFVKQIVCEQVLDHQVTVCYWTKASRQTVLASCRSCKQSKID